MVETLRDDAAREELILQLEALLEAQGAGRTRVPAPESDGMDRAALSFLSHKAEAFGSLADDAARFVSGVPALAGRLAAGAVDAKVRAEWLEFLVELVLVVGAGFLVEWLVIRLIARPRFELREREGDGLWLRGLFLVERTLLDLAPVGAFGIASYATLSLVAPGPGARVVALIVVNSNLIVRAITVLARMVLRPRYSSIRFVGLSDATANYLYFWVRRFAVVSVYGFYIADAVLLLGAGRGPYALVQNLVGLLVAAMFIMLVLQNRTAVRAWIAGSEPPGSRAWGRVRSSFAEIWHVFSIGYTVAVFAVWTLELEGGFDFVIQATVVSLVTVAIAYGVVAALREGVERGFQVNEETRQRFPSLEERVNRNRGFLEIALRSVILLVAGLVVLDAWGLGHFAWLSSERGRVFLGHFLTIVFVAGGALVAWELLSTLVERYLEERDESGEVVQREARIRTFLPLLRNVARIVLLVFVVLIVLAEIGVNIGPLLAGAGIVGLAISFGAQSLVKDIITGFFILLEDTISVGDVVDLGGHKGVVEGMSIRSVRLRDLEGIVHTIPFGEVASVLNMTKDFSFAFMEVGIAYREDVDEVIEALRAIGDGMQSDEEFGPLILEPLEVLGLDSFGASSVNIRIRLKTLPIKQWQVKREYQRRMKRVFDERGIEIPFPHQTVYFGTDKAGQAAAARIVLDNTAGEEPNLELPKGTDSPENELEGTRNADVRPDSSERNA
ncbi:MAG: mechanosensitive ion channel [Thiotrichales bacterium]|nr:mechanosensitive ion channel [Thiotrichales bacterium]